MPMTPTGFQPNPQVAAMHNKAAAPPAPAAPPMADPMQPKSITLTEQPDGTYSLDDGSGQAPIAAGSLDEAMQHIQTMMGGDTGDEMGENPTGDTGEVSDDGGGGGEGY